jgi:threonine/homoserine/homoserine lactone efflux protein
MGMGFGSVIWASAAIAGLALVLEQAIWLYSILKLAGGAYLIYLAYLLWNQAREKISIDAAPAHHISTFRAFGLGLLTQLANPKVIVFFGSIFFALLPADAPGWVYFASVLIVFTNETVWYSIVSLVFSIQQSRNAYMRARCLIDRGMAVALGGIGGKLVVDAIQTPSNN